MSHLRRWMRTLGAPRDGRPLPRPPVGPLRGLPIDVRVAARRLAATPLFLTLAVVSLGVGIAVTTVAYSVLAAFWKPIGIAGADRVAVVAVRLPQAGTPVWLNALSHDDFVELQQAAPGSFESLAASAALERGLLAPAGGGTVVIEAVSGRYFETLQVPPALGRMLQAPDGEQAAAVIVLSDRAWRRWFAADPNVVGRVTHLGGQPFEIAGVARASFDGLLRAGGGATDVWVPIETLPLLGANGSTREGARVSVLGRLSPGRTIGRAAQEVAALGAALDGAHPLQGSGAGDGGLDGRTRQWSLVSMADPHPGRTAPRLAIALIGFVALVLIVACTNLSNLMLARGIERSHDLAVRRALGASRWRLLREYLVEGSLIAAGGGLVAAFLAWGLVVLVRSHLPLAVGGFQIEPVLDVRVLLIASSALAVSLLVFGFEPAWQLTRPPAGGLAASASAVLLQARPGRQL